MLFTSFKFIFFFCSVFILYWALRKNSKAQNGLLLIANYVFYGMAEWRMIPLLLVSTVLFFWLAILIERNIKNERKSQIYSVIGIIIGIGILLYFKYFNFFIQSFSDLFAAIGLKTNWHTFTILMPLGVSYFTFKLISYIIEVYQENTPATRNFVTFANYVAFFPTILAGPIDRPNSLISQFAAAKAFSYQTAVDGCRQILCGVFKKVIIADVIASAIDPVWADIGSSKASTLVVCSFLYTIQVYNDFSGYSDMAIGLGKLLGINVVRNFNYPFFATNIAEYWRRWHMSLTSWLTDYVFTPLSFSFRKWGKYGIILATVINMVLVGLWHGANWTFVVFGLYQGLLFIPLIIKGKISEAKIEVNKHDFPKIKTLAKMVGVFLLVSMGSVLFRAENLTSALHYYYGMINLSLFEIPEIPHIPFVCIVSVLVVLILEWKHRDKEYMIMDIDQWGWVFKYSFVRNVIYCGMIFLVLLYGGEEQQFIYFQF